MTKRSYHDTLRRYHVVVPFQFAMLIASVWLAVLGGPLFNIFALIGGAVALFAPIAVELVWRLPLSRWFQFSYAVFLFGAIFCGYALDMYSRWWPWDSVLHAFSGVVVAWFGIIVLNEITKRWAPILPRWLYVVGIVMFCATVALLWEVVEFTSDTWFGTTAQHGVHDTMTDMIYGTVSGLAAGLVYKLYNK